MSRAMLEELLGTKMLLPRYRGRGVMGWVDLVTLFAILSGATLWGLIALGIDVPIHEGWQIRGIYGFIGVSALWQWGRQRLF